MRINNVQSPKVSLFSAPSFWFLLCSPTYNPRSMTTLFYIALRLVGHCPTTIPTKRCEWINNNDLMWVFPISQIIFFFHSTITIPLSFFLSHVTHPIYHNIPHNSTSTHGPTSRRRGSSPLARQAQPFSFQLCPFKPNASNIITQLNYFTLPHFLWPI